MDEYKVFLWFFVDRRTEVTYKIYAIARTVGEARAKLSRLPMDAYALIMVDKADPQAWALPWVEFNASGNGKAASWCDGQKLGFGGS